MVDFRYPKRHEYRWTHFHCNEILLITSMAILCVCSQTQGQSLGNDNKCSEYTTCKSCTTIVEHGCSWSLKEQKCGNQTINMERFILRDKQSCPNYLVEKLDTYSPSNKDMTISYNVTISFDNTLKKYYNFSEAKNIACVMLATRVTIEKLPNENQINCTWHKMDTAPLSERKAIVYPVVAMVDDMTIKLENDNDYYLTVYDRSCVAANKTDEYCVTCLWHDSRHRYYNRWCSAKNTCTGRWSQSMVHAVHSGSEVQVAGEETTLMCAEIGVQLNGATSGVAGGGRTTVELTVANHWILREHFTAITVTVAGLDCAQRPDTENGSNDTTTIACTVRAPNDATEGPVRVAYTSSEKRRYVVASVQPFKFVKPVLMDLRAGYVSRDGQRWLTIYGRHLDAGNEATVTVDERVACQTVARTSDRIECLIGPAEASTAAARASVAFDGSPAVHVDGTEHSGLAELDPQQRFETIASGGISLAVRGRRFAGATSAFMNIDGVRGVLPNCHVLNDTYMVCRTPNTRMPSGSDAVLMRDFSIVFVHNHSGSSSAMAYSSQSPSALVTYHDPVFVDFHVQNQQVVINVNAPNRGYGTDQLTVRFANTTDRCTVTETSADRVLCAPPSSPTVVLADVHRLVVTLGDTFERNVTRKFIAPVDDRNDAWSVTTVLCWTLVVLCSIVFLGFHYDRRYRYGDIMTDHSDLVPLY